MKFMKYFVLTCENKKGVISIDPVYHLSVIPYKILDEKTELMEHNTFLISKGKQKNDVISFEKHWQYGYLSTTEEFFGINER